MVFSVDCKLAPKFLNVSVVVAIRALALLNIVPMFLFRVLIADVALVVAVSMAIEVGRVKAAALVLAEFATDEATEIGLLFIGAVAMVERIIRLLKKARIPNACPVGSDLIIGSPPQYIYAFNPPLSNGLILSGL